MAASHVSYVRSTVRLDRVHVIVHTRGLVARCIVKQDQSFRICSDLSSQEEHRNLTPRMSVLNILTKSAFLTSTMAAAIAPLEASPGWGHYCPSRSSSNTTFLCHSAVVTSGQYVTSIAALPLTDA